ncbi:hypothetical protein [Parathalassolituus penaei]|uniref:Guanylate cyclase domain-containing protein n=1 Tax=Parathalassolituus penaei TaxID=2997323 RepID=A0A9X3EDC0_9GAMM|nr:hypothetical protein [Parathalassolituus penaei]MCY0965474.1 hypothetical protein [Parathalassolituus penaei]
MLTKEQDKEIRLIVNNSLNKAERHWSNGGILLAKSEGISMESFNKSLDSEPSKIPGHSIVQDEETVIDEFVAFVADMRNSTQHLMCELSSKRAKASRLQRVYYETSALLPAIAKTVNFEGGNVTEYLGDGILALFRFNPNNPSESIYAAHDAAINVIGDTRNIVNEILRERYLLPDIDIGVGLAHSKTLVTLVGLEGEKHPKAFGECIFRATKLSGGKNEILADENVKNK